MTTSMHDSGYPGMSGKPIDENLWLPDTGARKRQVLIVDNEPTGRSVLEQVVASIGDDVLLTSVTSAAQALNWMRGNRADLIISGYRMPEINGVDFIRHVRTMPEIASIPIMMATIVSDRQLRYDALEAGATVFMTRPIDRIECRAVCRNLLELRGHQTMTEERAELLASQVERVNRQLLAREHETLLRLGRAGEYRDLETGNHVIRMARYARIIADELGLDPARCEEIEFAAPMHDIGKIGIPDTVLKKPGRFNDDEWMQMRQHTVIGHKILSSSQSRFIRLGAVIALNHHEKFNGAGYPHGLGGEEIPLAARIVAVADVFDALMSARPYKRPWNLQTALIYIKQQSGAHFDPACVEAFFTRIVEIKEISCELHDR